MTSMLESFDLAFEPRFYHCSHCPQHLMVQKMKWPYSTVAAVLAMTVVAALHAQAQQFVVVMV